ncbi:hypothetical protein LR48_Vigan08g124400 [Vigna angularis]|uniref:Uncharacterized protein n=1 Tax=Phaseolus angularis TaxID=3914 RepID=A0A0L9V630_PHAAN|nr:hypothetical protein LR48_Vigan08g124400 [Vigna angularis]
MRSFSKNKFLCFRPVVDIDCMLKSEVAPHRSSSPSHFSRVPTSEKQQMVTNSKPKSVYFHHVSPKRTISRVIKAAFYETILNKRDHHKNRYIHDSFVYKHKNLNTKDSDMSALPVAKIGKNCKGGRDRSSSSTFISLCHAFVWVSDMTIHI